MPRAAFPNGRKSLLLLALALVAAIGAAWWWRRPPPEPAYQGQGLSTYLASFSPEAFPRPQTPMTAFGPGTVPWLAYQVEHGRYPFVRHGPLPFDHAPGWLRQVVPARWGGLRGAVRADERFNAAAALGTLGPDAAPAIPALLGALESDDDGLVRQAAVALNKIGPASWPAVQKVFQQGPPKARWFLVASMLNRLKLRGEDAPDVEVLRTIDVLMKAWRDPDFTVQDAASMALSDCFAARRESTLFNFAIPELLTLLFDSDRHVGDGAAYALRALGPRTAGSIPRLIEWLDSPDENIRRRAAEALEGADIAEKRSEARLRILCHDPNYPCQVAAQNALSGLRLPPEPWR